jgi:hypothetical protein
VIRELFLDPKRSTPPTEFVLVSELVQSVGAIDSRVGRTTVRSTGLIVVPAVIGVLLVGVIIAQFAGVFG